MRPISTLLLVLAALMLWACEQTSVMPRSSGRPYEVVVVGDEGPVGMALEADAEVLPQSEPCFDVKTTGGHEPDARMRLARSIVIVTIDPTRRQTTISYEKDVYAKPQMVVSIYAPSSQQLTADMPRWAPSLRQLLTRHEMNAAITALRSKPNPRATKTVEETIGVDMSIPADMQACKRGRGFVWLSNNSLQSIQSICLYHYPMGADFAAMRDSIMRRNIPGETDSMYMQTVVASLKQEPMNEKGTKGTIVRGLWEMKGDAMGGPFVAHVVADSSRQLTIVAEAFVYAPEGSKRNKVRQAEAALYTMTLAGKKQEQKER